MAKKIKELTDVLLNRGIEGEDLYHETIRAAELALENECYEQAWNHFYELFTLKTPQNKNINVNYFRGEGGYGLCKVMQEIPNDHEFVTNLIATDPDLIRKSKARHISNEFARKYIGRKYLLEAADTYGHYPSMVEYALNCVGKGPKKSFVFEYNEKDAQVGLQWANRLILSKDNKYKAKGYIVRAIYHFGRFTKNKSAEDSLEFCENVMKARSLMGERDEYALYFYGHVCSNPNFQRYEGGQHYNPRKGYELFCKVIDSAEDPDLVASAKNLKTMFETKYPSKIK